jgi:aldehyde oxidoreductase
MKEFIPGRTETFHDYLIPTLRDVPPIDVILIEDSASVGPYGAKGIGEPSLVPTAAAIFNAIFDAIDVRIYRAPASPDVVLRAINSRRD